MRRSGFLAAGLLALALTAGAAPRIDNVLVRMVPRGVDSLVGAHMDQILASDLYQKMVAQQRLPQLDQFARETGFDPRRDVREVLLARGYLGSALLARGKFNPKMVVSPDFKPVRHGEYTIYTGPSGGYCILDNTLAIAGDFDAISFALDEWKSGTHTNAQTLLAMVGSMNEQTQLWGVSTGFAAFLANNLPRAGNGLDFSAIFKGVENTWFSANATSGLQATIHATTATEKDAQTLRDAAKALIGFGRLSVPDNRPELLKFWDGITADQTGRNFVLNADVSGDLIDQMVKLFSAPAAGRGGAGRGRGGSGGRGGQRPRPL